MAQQAPEALTGTNAWLKQGTVEEEYGITLLFTN
jgi:hypothetical protein